MPTDRTEPPDTLRDVLAEALQSLKDPQGIVWGPTVGENFDAWQADAIIVALAARNVVLAPKKGRKPDGWHTYHICGGLARELTWSGHEAMCPVCGQWIEQRVTEARGDAPTPEPRGLDAARLAEALRYVERTMQYAMGVKAPEDGPPDEWYEGYARAVVKRLAATESPDTRPTRDRETRHATDTRPLDVALTAALADVTAAYHHDRKHEGRWTKCQHPRCQNARLAVEGRGPFAALPPATAP